MSYRVNELGEIFYFTTDFPNTFFEVDMCGYTPANPDYHMFRWNNHVSVFEYVVSGKGHIDAGNQSFTVGAGDFYLLKKGFTGHYYADRDDPFEKIWVNVDGELVEHMLEIYRISDSVTVYHCPDDRIRGCIDEIHEILKHNSDTIESFRRCSLKLIELLSLINGDILYRESGYVSTLPEKIRCCLNKHIFEEITLPQLADIFYMHEATLIRLFKSAYGVTPMKYLNALRIQAAGNMLHDHWPIKEIAAVLKYKNASYFSQCFKKETGMTPKEYMESL